MSGVLPESGWRRVAALRTGISYQERGKKANDVKKKKRGGTGRTM